MKKLTAKLEKMHPMNVFWLGIIVGALVVSLLFSQKSASHKGLGADVFDFDGSMFSSYSSGYSYVPVDVSSEYTAPVASQDVVGDYAAPVVVDNSALTETSSVALQDLSADIISPAVLDSNSASAASGYAPCMTPDNSLTGMPVPPIGS